MRFFRANDESKNGNSKNINATAFKEQCPLHNSQIYNA